MFLIRRSKTEDVPTLLKLARMVHFINLPPDKDIIDGKTTWSRQCFMLAHETGIGAGGTPRLNSPKPKGLRQLSSNENGALAGGLKNITSRSPLFMFVMEECEDDTGHPTGSGVIGTSQIIAKMGGPGHPNISLQLGEKHLFSQSLQMGVTHTVAKLYLDETGPTEIGGLIMQPSYRGHKQKLGRLISFVRFHYMGLYRHMFADRVLAEMMGPITIDGHNPFWDNCTRQFINMTYDDADKFCQESKEFILTLFPREEIYLTLLPPQARSTVGTVGPETVPARRMLEKLGFRYHKRVDPFDGGPHLEAPTDQIDLVKRTMRLKVGDPVKTDGGKGELGKGKALREHGIVSFVDRDGEFRAVETAMDRDGKGRLILPEAAFVTLQAQVGGDAGFTAIEPPVQPRLSEVSLGGSGGQTGGQTVSKGAKMKGRVDGKVGRGKTGK